MVLEENLWEMFCFKLSDPKHQVLWFKNVFGEPYKDYCFAKGIFNHIKYWFGLKMVYR